MQITRALLSGTVLAAALVLPGCTTEPEETTDNSPPATSPDVTVASNSEGASPTTPAVGSAASDTAVASNDSDPPPLELPPPDGHPPIGLPDPSAFPADLPDAPLASAESLATWTTDLEQAKARAQAEGKDLLLNFTGSDWCRYCMQLNQEVFQFQPFFDYANENFVLVKLDFPRGPGAITEEQLEANSAIRDYYGDIIEGFPAILLTDASGRVFATTGYDPRGLDFYVDHLADLREVRAERDAAFTAAAELEGAEKAKKLEEGLMTMSSAVLFPNYASVVDEIIELDADNSAGLNEKYTEQRDDHRFFQRVSAIEKMANSGDLKETVDDVLKAMDQLVADFPNHKRGQSVVASFRVVVLAAAERDDEALASATETLKRDDLSPPLRSQVVDTVFRILMTSNQFAKVIPVVDSELKNTADPFQKTNLLVLKANCQIKLKQFDAARLTFVEARETGGPQFWEQIDSIEKRMLEEAGVPEPEATPATTPEKPAATEKDAAAADEESDSAAPTEQPASEAKPAAE